MSENTEPRMLNATYVDSTELAYQDFIATDDPNERIGIAMDLLQALLLRFQRVAERQAGGFTLRMFKIQLDRFDKEWAQFAKRLEDADEPAWFVPDPNPEREGYYLYYYLCDWSWREVIAQFTYQTNLEPIAKDAFRQLSGWSWKRALQPEIRLNEDPDKYELVEVEV